jgi:excisionase family DNA binding protein
MQNDYSETDKTIDNRNTPLAYTIAEACAIAGIRRTTLYKHIRAGKLRAIKIGQRTFFLRDDIHRWLEGMPPIVPAQSQCPDVRNCSRWLGGSPSFGRLRNASRVFSGLQRRHPKTLIHTLSKDAI